MALKFNIATSDRVLVAGAASINDLAAFTVVVWAHHDSFVLSRIFWAKGTTGQKRFGTSGGTLGQLVMTVNYVTNNFNTPTTTFAVAPWNFIAGIYDGVIQNRIFQGTLTSPPYECAYGTVATNGTGGAASEAGGQACWGNRTGSNVAFPGSLAMGAVWNRALTRSELHHIWRESQIRPFVNTIPGCVEYHRFGVPPPTATVPDLSGNSNVGTITGATITADPVFTQPWSTQLKHMINAPAVPPPTLRPWQFQGQMGGLIAQ